LRTKLWAVITAESAISYDTEGECCIACFCIMCYIVSFVSCHLHVCVCVCVCVYVYVLPDIDMGLFHIQLSSDKYWICEMCVCVFVCASM
jgi:hypothetical protein